MRALKFEEIKEAIGQQASFTPREWGSIEGALSVFNILESEINIDKYLLIDKKGIERALKKEGKYIKWDSEKIYYHEKQDWLKGKKIALSPTGGILFKNRTNNWWLDGSCERYFYYKEMKLFFFKTRARIDIYKSNAEHIGDIYTDDFKIYAQGKERAGIEAGRNRYIFRPFDCYKADGKRFFPWSKIYDEEEAQNAHVVREVSGADFKRTRDLEKVEVF